MREGVRGEEGECVRGEEGEGVRIEEKSVRRGGGGCEG